MIPLRETPRERAIMRVYLAAIAILPMVAVFAHRGAAVLILLMGAAAALQGLVWRKGLSAFVFRTDYSKPLTLGVVSFIFFCLWILLSASWSPQGDSARLAAKVFFPTLASGAVVWDIIRRPVERTHRLSIFYSVCVIISLALLVEEILTGAPLRDFVPPQGDRYKDFIALGRGQTLVIFAAFPAWLILVRWLEHAAKRIGERPSKILRFTAPLILSGAVIWVALELGIAANAVAMGFGCIAAFAALRAPRTTLLSLLWIVLATLLLAPLAAYAPIETWIAKYENLIPISWAQRLHTWRATAGYALDCLPFGCGADFARTVQAQGAVVILPQTPVALPIMPTHPHNIFLQVWMELGAAGAMLFGLAIFGAGLALVRASLPAPVAAGAAGAIAAIFVSAMVEASLWQVWRLSAMGLAALGVALSYAFNLKEVEWVHRGVGLRSGAQAAG